MTKPKGSDGHHNITLEIQKGVSGVYVGQVKEIPGIIVQAKTMEALEAETIKSFQLYMQAFPEEHDKLFHVEPAYQYKRLEVPLTH